MTNSFKKYKIIQKNLVHQYGGDKNATDISRVMRVPGFYNMKDQNNPYFITAEIKSLTPKSKQEILDILEPEPNTPSEQSLKKNYTERDFKIIKKALSYISSDDRETWIRFGIALKNSFGENGYEIWDEWSQESPKYVPGECEEKWRGFRDNGNIHIASIIYEAQRNGFITSYIPKAPAAEDDFDHYYETPLTLFNASDFDGKDIPKQGFVIKDLLVSGAPVSLYGDPGVGKSTLALQKCACIALGQDFMGFATTKAKCLILSCEDDLDEIHRRLARMCKTFGWNYADFEDSLVFCCRAGEDNLLVKEPLKKTLKEFLLPV